MRNLIHPAAVPAWVTAELRQHYASAAHEQLDSRGLRVPGGTALPGLSRLIQESWRRSAQLHANPDHPEAPLAMDREELEEYRRQHPLAAIMPVIHKLLVLPSHDSGCWWPWGMSWAGCSGWKATPPCSAGPRA